MAILKNLYSRNGEESSLIPISLIESGDHYPELRPRDTCVFIRLLMSPNGSIVDKNDIANGLNISVYSVNQAFKVLQKIGFISYTRAHTGQTEWTINLSSFEGGL
jgi:hypothetical protein